MITAMEIPLPHVNGVRLTTPTESISPRELRQRACTELLRQEAIGSGLLPADDPAPVDGAISEAAESAIAVLIEQRIEVPQPTEDACLRHYAAHSARYRIGERVRARHILFAVTPGIDVNALRQRAEACLVDVRSRTAEEMAAGDHFAVVAASTSNCPSGAQGGDLGWLTAQECAPEFARELFGKADVGVLPRLVHSRFGLHVVEIISREPGQEQPYAAVRDAVAQSLWQASFATALSQYVQVLAGRARVEGVELSGASTPLVQ